MPEPFKNFFNEDVILGMATHFKKQWQEFDDKAFVKTALNNLEALELKARSEQITNSMIQYLPEDFEQAGKIMLACLGRELGDKITDESIDRSGISGWGVMPMTHYVGLQGQDHIDLSMTLLKEMTKRFSSEFGIRFFLLESTEQTLSILKTWARDSNHHVRRLASEGSRPRLPWAMRLPMFINDPTPVIDLLALLKDDDKEYVRRSVANSLNDIAKDHPDVVAELAEQWMKGANIDRKRLIRHGCRSLIKNGHKKALEVLGYGLPRLAQAEIKILTPEVEFGSDLQFTLTIVSDSNQDQSLMIDYLIHHQKANGRTSPKVFKWKDITLGAEKTLTSTKKHGFKKITTRVDYPGTHRVEVMVNGVSVGDAEFQLLML